MRYHTAVIEQIGSTVSGMLEQASTVDLYSRALREELDLEGVAWEEVPKKKDTSSKDGTSFLNAPDGKLPLCLSLGTAKEGEIIHSKIRYSLPEGSDLAKTLEKACSQWGKKYEKWFASGGAVHDPALPQHRLIIVVEPFTINSRGAFELTARLDELGRDIALALSKWLKAQSKHVGFRPSSGFEKPWLTQAQK